MNRNYKYLFGPVPSRRLGRSLGVDLIPAKTCTLDCVYCECGSSAAQSYETAAYVPAKEVIAELDDYLGTKPILDVVTLAGTGEPTLNREIGPIVAHLKQRYPAYRLALLTNGTLFYRPEVRKSILPVDSVLPSVDAATQEAFRKINRGSSSVSAQRTIDGITTFSHEFAHTLWVEVFVVPGINDTESELAAIKQALSHMRLDRVQLNSLDRPGPCDWVQPVVPERMLEIAEFLKPLPVEIISRVARKISFGSGGELKEDELLNTLRRRPLTLEDIAITMGCTINEINDALQRLVAEGKVQGPRNGFYGAVQE